MNKPKLFLDMDNVLVDTLLILNAIDMADNVNNKEVLLGELKTLRAYFYFDLMRIFDRIPYFTENEDPNGKRIDEYTRDQIFGFIKQDLESAYNVLPESQSQVGRFNTDQIRVRLKVCCTFGS